MKDIILYCVLGLILMGTACNKDPLIDTQAGSTKDLHIPASFDFKATAEIGLDVIVKSASTILTGVPINIYLDNPGYSEAPNPDAKILGTYSSDDAGRIRQPLRLPSYQDTVYLQTGYFGLESLVAVPVIEARDVNSALLVGAEMKELRSKIVPFAAPVVTPVVPLFTAGVPLYVFVT